MKYVIPILTLIIGLIVGYYLHSQTSIQNPTTTTHDSIYVEVHDTNWILHGYPVIKWRNGKDVHDTLPPQIIIDTTHDTVRYSAPAFTAKLDTCEQLDSNRFVYFGLLFKYPELRFDSIWHKYPNDTTHFHSEIKTFEIKPTLWEKTKEYSTIGISAILIYEVFRFLLGKP